jgi:RimJ/RimL family protein N-acetyltransferase
VITTPRLVGRPLAESDLDDLLVLHRDLKILALFDPQDPEALTDEETREFLERRLAHWREHGFGIWVFRDPQGAFVGRCGIHRKVVLGKNEVELGYIVRSELWSQGYAIEMALAVAEHAFTELGLPDVVAFTREDNARSRRVLEKAGFVYETSYEDDGVPAVLYRKRPHA